MKKMLIYSNETFGMENLRAIRAISQQLLDNNPDLSILLISDSPFRHHHQFPVSRFDCLKLPRFEPITQTTYQAKKIDCNFDDQLMLRANTISSVVEHFRPDVMMVNKLPRGIAGELRPALELIRKSMPETEIVLLLGNNTETPQNVRNSWSEKGYHQSIENYYKYILVLGETNVFKLQKEYNFPLKNADKVIFCGKNGHKTSVHYQNISAYIPQKSKPWALLTSDSGTESYRRLKLYLQGIKNYPQPLPFASLIFINPDMQKPQIKEIRQLANTLNDITIVDDAVDFNTYIQAADVIVSMAEQHLIVDRLPMNKPGIFITSSKDAQQQLNSAIHMDMVGLFQCIPQGRFSTEILLLKITELVVDRRKYLQLSAKINLNGVKTAARILNLILNNSMVEKIQANPRCLISASNTLTKPISQLH